MPDHEYYFEHELAAAQIAYTRGASPDAAAKAKVYSNGQETDPPLREVDLSTDPGRQQLAASALADLAPQSSPFLIVFPADVTAAPPPTAAADPKPDPSLLERVKPAGHATLNFGKDSLTLTWSMESGGGLGGGRTMATGASASATGDCKVHWASPKLSLALLKDERNLALFLRFVLRFLYHSCDAVAFAEDWHEQHRGDDLGLLGWLGVFEAFAAKYALDDLVRDDAPFVAELLEKLGIELELDVLASAVGEVFVHFDLDYTLAAKCYLSLGTILHPVIEILCAASSAAPPPEGASLADRITPMIHLDCEDRLVLKLGGFPAGLVVECRGKPAQGSFGIPQGSPLRAHIERFAGGVSHAADEYVKALAQGVKRDRKLEVLKTVLGLVAAEIEAIVMQKNPGAAFEAASPAIQSMMSSLLGQTPPDATAPESGNAAQALAMLRATKLEGVALRPGSPLCSEDGEKGKRVWIHVADDELATLQGAGFAPPSPPQAVAESVRYRVPMPVVPAAVAWNVHRNPDEKITAQGIIAGFEHEADATAYVRQRAPEQVPEDSLRSVHENREGRFWVWVETLLVAHLATRKIGLPELARDTDGSLLLTFPEVALGSVSADDVATLAGAELRDRRTFWKVILAEDASVEQLRELQWQVDRNQPIDEGSPAAPDGTWPTGPGWGGPPSDPAADPQGPDSIDPRFVGLGLASQNPVRLSARRASASGKAERSSRPLSER